MVKAHTPWKQHTEPPHPAEEEEAGLALTWCKRTKPKYYLHYCRFWDVNVRNKLIVVFHEYFKRFHIAEKHEIMAAAKKIRFLQSESYQRYTVN